MDIKDYYKKDEIKKCDVCGQIVLVDQFGNGECENCGWVQNVINKNHPNKVLYPNLVSLEKAKRLYAGGMKITPSIDDFLDALFAYSEMLFNYNGKVYEVFLSGDENQDTIVLSDGARNFEFFSRKEFIENASVCGKRLKDVWSDVQDARFMS